MNCIQDITGREQTVCQLESLIMSGAGEEIHLVVWTHSLDSIKEICNYWWNICWNSGWNWRTSQYHEFYNPTKRILK